MRGWWGGCAAPKTGLGALCLVRRAGATGGCRTTVGLFSATLSGVRLLERMHRRVTADDTWAKAMNCASVLSLVAIACVAALAAPMPVIAQGTIRVEKVMAERMSCNAWLGT